MGVLFFLLIVVGLSWVAQDFVKSTREHMRELDSLRDEDEKHDSRIGMVFGTKGYELFKRKK